jgi:hypothetical protein
MSSLLPTESDEYLVLLTVDEAARLMRIGRTKAYAMAREYLNSGGTSGLPVISFGPGCLRVPRWALIELITTGRVPRLCDAVVDHHARVR